MLTIEVIYMLRIPVRLKNFLSKFNLKLQLATLRIVLPSQILQQSSQYILTQLLQQSPSNPQPCTFMTSRPVGHPQLSTRRVQTPKFEFPSDPHKFPSTITTTPM